MEIVDKNGNKMELPKEQPKPDPQNPAEETEEPTKEAATSTVKEGEDAKPEEEKEKRLPFLIDTETYGIMKLQIDIEFLSLHNPESLFCVALPGFFETYKNKAMMLVSGMRAEREEQKAKLIGVQNKNGHRGFLRSLNMFKRR